MLCVACIVLNILQFVAHQLLIKGKLISINFCYLLLDLLTLRGSYVLYSNVIRSAF